MHRRTIRCSLSADSINATANELKAYQRELERKTVEFRKRIAGSIAELAQQGFNASIVDDLTEQSGGARMASVIVEVSDGNDVSYVVANGSDAIWVEFGAGVHHNGAAGSSPHPKGAELGYTIGSYGKGKGSRDRWVFYDGGQKVMTYGTPANMPMYRACQAVADNIITIAREVYGT